MNLCNHILNRKILGSNTVDPFLLFIVLYPALDNLTENKCRRIAMFNGYGSAEISYLFSLNAASPEEVISTMPNNSELNNIPANVDIAHRIILAWGGYGKHQNRSAKVVNQLKYQEEKLYVLGITKNGEPAHPLKIKYNTGLIKYDSRRTAK